MFAIGDKVKCNSSDIHTILRIGAEEILIVRKSTYDIETNKFYLKFEDKDFFYGISEDCFTLVTNRKNRIENLFSE